MARKELFSSWPYQVMVATGQETVREQIPSRSGNFTLSQGKTVILGNGIEGEYCLMKLNDKLMVGYVINSYDLLKAEING